MTMGTASTMRLHGRIIGHVPVGVPAVPAVDSRKKALAHLSGRRIVEMVEGGSAHIKNSDEEAL